MEVVSELVEISPHTSLHVALENAVNLVLPCGSIDIVQSPKYSLMSDGTIKGAGFRVEYTACAENNISVKATWDAPAYRQDGSVFNISDVAGYEIKVNDKITALTDTTFTINGLEAGQQISLSVRTITITGGIGEWTDTLTLDI